MAKKKEETLSDIIDRIEEDLITLRDKVDDSAVDYVQKGLSTKSFFKQFSLPNDAVVDEATMEDGMLKIQFGIKETEIKSKKVNIK